MPIGTPPPVFLYVVRDARGVRKIGHTTKPIEERIRQLRYDETAKAVGAVGPFVAEYLVELPWYRERHKAEFHAQALLADRRVHGEWFAVSAVHAECAVWDAIVRSLVDGWYMPRQPWIRQPWLLSDLQSNSEHS
jgi:hypothetical protein